MSPSAFCCLASALVLLAVSAGPLSAAIKIAGSVVAGEQRIAGARVTLVPAADPAEGFESLFGDRKISILAATRSERDGSFELLAPEAGFFRVLFEADGYLGTLRWAYALTPSLVQLGPVELVPARRVRLAVRDPEGRPVAGARIRIRFKDQGLVRAPRWPLYYWTAEDGSALVAAPAGEEALGVAAVPGFALSVAKLAAGAESAEVRLEPGTELPIKAVDARRRPLPDVAVMVARLGTAIGRTGRDGQVSLRLLPGQEKLELLDAAGRRAALEVPEERAEGPLQVELAEPRSLAGQVVEAPGQAPVEEAWVFVWTWPPLFTRSDRGGNFELAALPPAGELEVQAVKEGYLRASAPASGPAPLILGLEPAARIEGRVKAGGRSVAGVRVSVTNDLSSAPRRFTRAEVETDKEGRYVLSEVTAGDPLEIDLIIGMRRLPSTKVPPLAAGESRVVDFDLPAGEAWACRVVDPVGNPVAGAEVVAMKAVSGMPRLTFANRNSWDQTFNLLRLGKTDTQGRLAAELPEAGTYDFGVLAKEFGPKLVRGVPVGDRESSAAPSEPLLPEEIVLNPAVAVRGRVVDASGQGIAEAGIFLDLPSDDPNGATYRSGGGGKPTTTSGADGEFSFREVDAGRRFALLASKEGYLPAYLEDAGTDGEPLRLVLLRGARIEGKVASGGRPVSRAQVELEQLEPERGIGGSGRGSRGFTDATGSYWIEGVSPGRYRLWSHGPDGFRDFRGESFEVSSGEKKVIDIEREKAVVVFGKVSLESGERVAGAHISYVGDAEDEIVRYGTDGRTDALGQYRLATAAAGAGWLRVYRPGHKELRRRVQLDQEINEVDLVIEAGSIELEGRVVGPGGEPIAGAAISLEADEVHREILSGPDGAFRLAGLESGEYLLQIGKQGYFFKPRQLELAASRRNLEWQLDAAVSRLRGQILGVAERELPDVEIAARLIAEGTFRTVGGKTYPVGVQVPGKIGAGGRFTVEGLVPGRWSLVAANPRAGAVADATVDIADGQSELEQDLDFGRLAGPWTAQIRQGGKSLGRFHYALVSATGGGLLFAPSPTGRLELRAPPGSYRLSIHLGAGSPHEIEIEIGPPSEQVIELPPP
jgi:hypothetical protein